VQAVRYGSLLQSQQWQQQEADELHEVCETRSAVAAAAAGLRISSASPNRANTSWHSTTSFMAQQQQQWRPSSAGVNAAATAAAAGQHAGSYWGSMPGYASSGHCSQAGAADTTAVAAQQDPCTRHVPLRPLASPLHFDSDGAAAGSLGARRDIRNNTGGGAATDVAAGVVPPAERYAALVAGADAALKQLAECRRAAAAHDAGSSCQAAAFGSSGSTSGTGAGFMTHNPVVIQSAATEQTRAHQAATHHKSWLPGQQLDSSTAFHSKHSQAHLTASHVTAAVAVAARAACAGVGAAANSSSLRWHESHEARASGNWTAAAAAAAPAVHAGACIAASRCGNSGSSVTWHELRAELQAMDGDLDAAEAALQAATARLGSRH
jgi:hypothetical protein